MLEPEGTRASSAHAALRGVGRDRGCVIPRMELDADGVPVTPSSASITRVTLMCSHVRLAFAHWLTGVNQSGFIYSSGVLMRFGGRAVVLTSTLLLLTACGGGGGDEAESPETVFVTRTAEAPSPSEVSSDEQSESAQPSETASESPDSESSDVPSRSAQSSDEGDDAPILGAEQKGESLTLSNFFAHSDVWEENRYAVADLKDLTGIAGEIDGCGVDSYSDPEELELRLANNFDSLTFSAGQGNGSPSGDQVLVVRVEGNGGQLDIKRIPFNEVSSFDLDITDVNSLVIQAYLDDEIEDCSRNGESQAVLWDFELQ